MCLIFHEGRLLGLFFSSPSFTELGCLIFHAERLLGCFFLLVNFWPLNGRTKWEGGRGSAGLVLLVLLPQILSRGLVFQDVRSGKADQARQQRSSQ